MSNKTLTPENENNLNDLVDKILDEVKPDTAFTVTDEAVDSVLNSSEPAEAADKKVIPPTAVMEEFQPKASNKSKPSNDDFVSSLQQNVVSVSKEAEKDDSSVPEGKTVSFTLDDKAKEKIIPNTEQLIMTDEEKEQQKITEVKSKRKKKVKDFVVRTEDDLKEEKEDELPDTVEEFDDYNSVEEAKPILKNLNQTKLSLLIRALFQFILSAALVYISCADSLKVSLPSFMDKAASPVGYISVNLILGVLVMLCSLSVMINGTLNFFKFKADTDSVFAVSMLAAMATPIALLINKAWINPNNLHLYISIASIGLFFNTVGKILIVSRTKRNFKFIISGSKKYSTCYIDDDDTAEAFTKGLLTDFPQLCTMRETELLTDFLKTSYSYDHVDAVSRICTPIFFALSVLIGVGAGMFHGDAALGLMTFSACSALSAPFAATFIANIPLSRASKKLAANSSVVLGYSAAEDFSYANSVIVDAASLFPDGSVSLVGFKVFKNKRVDEAFLNAASLCIHSGSVLSHIFYDIIGGKTSMLKKVENFVYEDSMGAAGWIDNRRVLFGNRELMKNHGIPIPSVEKEKKYLKSSFNNVLYLSVSGELCAMFIVEMKPSLEVANALRQLDKKDIGIVLKTVDSIITVSTLTELFEISPNIIKIMPFRLHEKYNEISSYTARASGAVASNGTLSSFCASLVACRKIRGCVNFFSAVHIASMVLGIGIVAFFAFLTGLSYFLPAQMIIYNLCWAVIICVLENAAS
ncbi:MAG: hypothetical protein ACI4JX_04025 [Oscillospiraceae bacterium]